MKNLVLFAAVVVAVASCASPEGKGLAPTPVGTGAAVTFDVYAKPLPNIPLPNDFATRFDPSSPTQRRVNASMQAATKWERATRETIDQLDGWGTYQSISVGFDKPLDVANIIHRQQGDDYNPSNDVALLINISPDSPDFCQNVPLDFGQGNFPITLENQEYYPNDFHNAGQQLVFEDTEEDANGNGKLDLGEDLDMDGVLDHPNLPYPGAGKFEIMNFYERETNTLIMKPVMPLRETTTYAVVLTRRLVDEDGRPVRSPFDYINHTTQTKQLQPLLKCLPAFGLSEDDVAFTWAYSTQSVTRDFKAVRDGLYGIGPMSRLATEFPAEVKALLPMRDVPIGSGLNTRIVSGQAFYEAAVSLLEQQFGANSAQKEIGESMKYIDYHVVFQFDAPQFFPRVDSEGKPLPLYKQIVDLDPVTGDAFTRKETITVWVVMPKRRRPDGTAPALILGHGYTGNKLDPLFYGGFMAKYGQASIGMENVSHGVALEKTDFELARALLSGKGLGPMFDSIAGPQNCRSFDQNGDGVGDSGADFWTAYIPHTRDVVRQSAWDYMQLVRVLKGFDGVKTWKYDANKDGKPDLAGDFDGDGRVDIGGSAPIGITGGSLGGIMSSIMAGAEPQIDVSLPVSAGAGLPDIGIRSIQGGVGEAVNLRMMGPLLVTLKNAMGELELWQYLPNLNGLSKVKVAPVPVSLNEGDTAVIFNKTTNEYRCSRVLNGGLLRAAVASDADDAYTLSVFRGPLEAQTTTGCIVPEGAVPAFTISTWGFDAEYQGRKLAKGSPLIALGDGFGLRRQTPEFRRFMGLAQMAVDKGDPVNWVPYAERWNLTYGTGETVRTRLLISTTIGDMNVPIATGAAVARAAGLIDFKNKDARYGKTVNQMLIDNGVLEGVERVGRYKSANGANVLMDIENFTGISGTDDGYDVPRLAPPLRAVRKSEKLGGMMGALFPMVVPTGRHGFDTPDPGERFDLGSFMLNLMGRYIDTRGEEVHFEPCMVNSTCSWVPGPPQQ